MRRRLVWIQGGKQFPRVAFFIEPLFGAHNWWNYRFARKVALKNGPFPTDATILPFPANVDGIDANYPSVGQFRPNGDWVFFGEGEFNDGRPQYSPYWARTATGYSAIVDSDDLIAGIGGTVFELLPWETIGTGFRNFGFYGGWDADWGIADFQYNLAPGDPLLWGSVVMDRNGIVNIQTSPTGALADITHYVFPNLNLTVPASQRLDRLVYCAIDRSKIIWRDPNFVWRIAYSDGTTMPLTVADPRLSGETPDLILGGWSTAAWDGTTNYLYVAGSGYEAGSPPIYKDRRLRIDGGEIWLDYEVPGEYPDPPLDGYSEAFWIDLY